MKPSPSQWRMVANMIPYKWFSEMERMALDSNFDGYERAFTLCQAKDGTVRKSDDCKGEKCSVGPPSCEVEEEDLGYYHTHPGGMEDFSVGDSNHALVGRKRIQCVGTITEIKYRIEREEIIIPTFRVQCRSWWLEHPLYEAHRQKIREVSEKVHSIELEMAKGFFEEKMAIPSSEYTEYETEKQEFYERLEEAEKISVAIKPSLTQGIDESFGSVSRKLIELV